MTSAGMASHTNHSKLIAEDPIRFWGGDVNLRRDVHHKPSRRRSAWALWYIPSPRGRFGDSPFNQNSGPS